jgi:Alpha-glucuronidase
VKVHVSPSSSELEQRAALDLARALSAVTGVPWSFAPGFANPGDRGKSIVLGTVGQPEIDALVASARIQADLAWAGPEGYVITTAGSAATDASSLLLIAANTPEGALYGAFRAASLAGARFYLSRESARPELRSEAFARRDEPWPALRLAERPRFVYRGALPWFNFLSGPTAWDREDWAVYVDNLARSRANLLGFHVYTGGLERYYPYVEPFIEIEIDGVLPEAELDTTATARWGYRPLSTQRFAAGTSLLFPHPVFGSEAAVPRQDLRSRYQRAQELLAWVMKRAKTWGIRSSLGLEAGIAPPEVHSLIPPGARLPSGELDPFHPAAQRLFHRTLERIVTTYPDLEALWLFQHEHVLFSQIPPTGRAALEAYCHRHQEAFPELPEDTRWKGPWLLAWVENAWKWKERHAPHLKIAVSGWGGGSQFPRLIPGLHRTMPSDVMIAALLPGQGEGSLPPELANVTGRERIAVPWFEGDAQLWHPQPRVESLLEQQDEFSAHGVDGAVGLHWRTQDIEANAWAFFEGCWESRPEPSRSAAACYADYAAYGLGLGLAKGKMRAEVSLPAQRPDGVSTAAAETAALLHRSEKERWFHGAHSPVYFGYTSQWGRLAPKQRETIEQALKRLVELGSTARKTGRDGGARGGGQQGAMFPAFRHLIHSWKFVLHLDEWSRAIGEAENALQSGDAHRALEILAQAPARETLHAYAARVMTQGDRGALASVNQRVWLAHRDLLMEAAAGVSSLVASEDTDAEGTGKIFGASFDASATGTVDWAVVLPVRTHWDALRGDTIRWRVLTGSLDAQAAFLVAGDSTAERRFPMEQAGVGAFELTLPASAFDWAKAPILKTRVEVLFFGSPAPVVPKGGEQTVTILRAFDGNQERG